MFSRKSILDTRLKVGLRGEALILGGRGDLWLSLLNYTDCVLTWLKCACGLGAFLGYLGRTSFYLGQTFVCQVFFTLVIPLRWFKLK